jgi:hypothetical protein
MHFSDALMKSFVDSIASHHVFMAGVDFPLTNPNPFERIFRFTYIYCF